MNNSNDDIDVVTQTTRIQKPANKPTVKEVPVIPVSGRPSVAKPAVKPVTVPILKQPRTDTVKLKVVRSTGPVIPAPIKTASDTKTVKIEKSTVSTKTVKLTHPVKKEAPTSKIEVKAPEAPKVAKVTAPVSKPVEKKAVSRKPVSPKKKAAVVKEEISFDVSDFEDDNVEPSVLFMVMNLASAAMFVAGLVIVLIK